MSHAAANRRLVSSVDEAEVAAALSDYYGDPAVRARIREFLGGTTAGEATAVFLTDHTPTAARAFQPRPLREIEQLLGAGMELARSLWDRRALLAHLDLEHVAFDEPWRPYVDAGRSLELQRPAARAVAEILEEHGIRPLHLLSGRGHHFVWSLEQTSPAAASLARLGRPGARLLDMYRQPQPPGGEVVGEHLGAAFHGLGLVMEYLAHRVLERAAPQTPISVQLTAVVSGSGLAGREVVSIDVSEYGDPLHKRTIRVPFTAYLKAFALGKALPAPDLPALIMLPSDLLPETEAIAAMARPERARALARRSSARIPDASAQSEALIASYAASPLAAFHRDFHATAPEPPERWPASYDRLDLAGLPPCVRRALEHPNDLLLRPAWIQLVVRTLVALGWHPRHVAGLVRSKYERDFGWVPDLHFWEAATRADFYVRLFAGLVATGRDQGIDFNCRSSQEKDMCTESACPWNLASLQPALLRERRHG
jgi:hypothetical protein